MPRDNSEIERTLNDIVVVRADEDVRSAPPLEPCPRCGALRRRGESRCDMCDPRQAPSVVMPLNCPLCEIEVSLPEEQAVDVPPGRLLMLKCPSCSHRDSLHAFERMGYKLEADREKKAKNEQREAEKRKKQERVEAEKRQRQEREVAEIERDREKQRRREAEDRRREMLEHQAASEKKAQLEPGRALNDLDLANIEQAVEKGIARLAKFEFVFSIVWRAYLGIALISLAIWILILIVAEAFRGR